MINSYNKTRYHIFSNFFWNKTLHVSDSSSVHHQEFFTVHTEMVYVIQVCCMYSAKISDDGQRNCPKHVEFHSKNKFEKTYHCYVYSATTPDDGQRNCPKHVEFYTKNKFEKLVHLVGFITRIYFLWCICCFIKYKIYNVVVIQYTIYIFMEYVKSSLKMMRGIPKDVG